MGEVEKLKEEIEKIKARNARVERDKAWETSWTRKIAIAVVTYTSISIFLFVANFDQPFKSAIVPTIGFVLSTLSLDLIKNWWVKK